MKSEVSFFGRRCALMRAAVLSFVGFASVGCLPQAVWAQQVIGTDGTIAVTEIDLRAAAELFPLAARSGVLSRRENIVEQAQGVYLRRALTAEAVRDGQDKDAVVQGLLTLMRERVLSDARLGALDESTALPEAALESYAQAAYKADPKRFEHGPQARVRHILVRNSGPEAKAKAEALMTQLKGGASFEVLAQQNSGDVATLSKGGDLGYVDIATMSDAFQAALAELKNPGDLSGIVQTDVGYHIVKLEGRREAGLLPYDEVRTALRAEARTRALQDARAEKINKLLAPFKVDQDAAEAFSRRYR